MSENKTIYQKLGGLFGSSGIKIQDKEISRYNIADTELLRTTDKAEFELGKKQMLQNKYLQNQWQRVEHEIFQKSVHQESTRIGSYSDFEAMEFYPEIAAALDIFSEECCLHGDTKIKLLNGKIFTIKELYDSNCKDFWVYAVDTEDDTIKPSIVDSVIFKGVKDVYKITLDNGYEIMCTDDHKWLTYGNDWIETKDLVCGESLKSITSKLSKKGYEKVSLYGGLKSRFTHSIVCENLFSDEKLELKSRGGKNDNVVVHHKSFNKLNNDPSELVYMLWSEHTKLHTDLNTDRWLNPEFSTKMRKIFSDTIKKTINERGIDNVVSTMIAGLNRKLATLTPEEFRLFFARPGERNGMYGVSRYGSLNPNFNHNKNHIPDIDEKVYINFIASLVGNRNKIIAKHFNMSNGNVLKYNRLICEKYGLKRIEDVDYMFNDGFNIERIKNFIIEHNLDVRSCSIYLKKYNIKHHKLLRYINSKGYKNWTDIISTIGNHRVVSVEYVGKSEVYDLLNSSVSSNFGVVCGDNSMLISHNCTVNDKGKILNIYSDSERVRGILEDLFFNRLDIHTTLHMWVRNVCKLGDNFLYLNMNDKQGIIGAKQLPIYEIERREIDLASSIINKDKGDETVKFVWRGRNIEFNSWQIAHFRLLNDDRKLPYGTSLLEKCRRIWKGLVLMEDAMMVYRITRAPERRVFKVNVGNIDEEDVPAYINQMANKFKRTPVIDSKTGQIDTKYNQYAADQDYIIPVRSDNVQTPIETLPGASNLSDIEDIKMLQAKLFTALRVPKSFLGFDDAVGDGKNLALQDIRFTRTVNRIQQAIIMELNKIAIIHLYLLGFEDELDNFSITMNNPSTQAEMLKIEHWQQRITVYQEAVRDSGNGFGAMSMTRAKRDFLGMSNDEIKQDLLEQRMEKAAAAELEQTSTVIKKTGFFDIVDNIYGIPEDERESENTDGADGGESDAKGGFGGGGGFGGDDMDLGDDTENTDNTDNTEQTDSGNNEDTGFDDAGADSFGGDEADFGKKEESFIRKTNNILTEKKDILNKRLSDRTKRFESIYTNRLIESVSPENINRITSKFANNSMSVNNDIDFMIKSIDKLVGDE